jgi:hypothetical protein
MNTCEISMDMHPTRLNITGKIQCWSKDAALKKTLESFPNPEHALYIHVIGTLESNESDDKRTCKVQAHTKAYKDSLMKYVTVLSAYFFLHISKMA